MTFVLHQGRLIDTSSTLLIQMYRHWRQKISQRTNILHKIINQADLWWNEFMGNNCSKKLWPQGILGTDRVTTSTNWFGQFFISFILDYGKLLHCLKLMMELKWLKGFFLKNQKNTEEQSTIYIASSNHYWSLKQVFRVEGFSIKYISCREVARKIGT